MKEILVARKQLEAYFTSSAARREVETRGAAALGKGGVNSFKRIARSIVLDSDNDPVGRHEISDRISLAEKFWIRCDLNRRSAQWSA